MENQYYIYLGLSNGAEIVKCLVNNLRKKDFQCGISKSPSFTLGFSYEVIV